MKVYFKVGLFIIFSSGIAQSQVFNYQNQLNQTDIVLSDFYKYGATEFQFSNDSLQLVNSNQSFTAGAIEFKKKLNLNSDFSISLNVHLNSTKNFNLSSGGDPYGYLMAGFGITPQSYSSSLADYKKLMAIRFKRDNYYSGVNSFVSESTTYDNIKSEHFNIGPTTQTSDVTLKAEYCSSNKTIYFYWKPKSDISYLPLCSRNLVNEWNLDGNESLTLLIFVASDGTTTLINDMYVESLSINSKDNSLFLNNVNLTLQRSYNLIDWSSIFTNSTDETSPKAFYRLQIQK